MPAIHWNNSLVNNVAVIDQQHMKLVEMINGFYDALHDKKPQEALEQLLDGMAKYTQFHFSIEEDFMKKHDYPFAHKHLAEHKGFVAHVSEWQEMLAKRQLVLSLEITNYLKTWLVDHISELDKNLCKFLNTKGVV